MFESIREGCLPLGVLEADSQVEKGLIAAAFAAMEICVINFIKTAVHW